MGKVGMTPTPKEVGKILEVEARRNATHALREIRQILLDEIIEILLLKKASGTLIDSIKSEIKHTRYYVDLIYYSTSQHAAIVHEGRKPGTWPYVPAIRQWIMDKSNYRLFDLLAELGIVRLAYIIGKKIMEEGIPPFPFFKLALEKKQQDIFRIVSKYGFSHK